MANKLSDFFLDIQSTSSVIVAGHRDSMWAFMMPIEGLTPEQLSKVDTNDIKNGQIWHYSSINPKTGESQPTLMWKRSINPNFNQLKTNWQKIENCNSSLT